MHCHVGLHLGPLPCCFRWQEIKLKNGKPAPWSTWRCTNRPRVSVDSARDPAVGRRRIVLVERPRH